MLNNFQLQTIQVELQEFLKVLDCVEPRKERIRRVIKEIKRMEQERFNNSYNEMMQDYQEVIID